MPDMGGWEWVILGIVALLLFGGPKLADIGKNAGKAIREFKEETSSTHSGGEPPEPDPTPAAPAPPAGWDAGSGTDNS